MNRKCCKDCENCEMLIPNETIVFLKSGFDTRRREVPAVKCMKFGQYAENTAQLPTSELLDDTIWV